MSVGTNAPVIVKRKKVVGGGGHHGGAWKVAYADFVTAMMAFFMLMWLLNATTEKQRKGIADYFSPTIPLSRTSGGGNGSLDGDSVFTEDTLTQHGVGGLRLPNSPPDGSASEKSAGMTGESEPTLEELEQVLLGSGGELLATENAMRHVVTRLTDEGLVVELFSLDGAPLFGDGTGEPTDLLTDLVAMVGRVFLMASNPVAVKGYSRSYAVVLRHNPAWDESLSRAGTVRDMISLAIGMQRVERVTGLADRQPVAENPMSMRNDRIELVLLRSDV
ncbi:flagellar motor protein MotB [Tropicimonas sp.]|uniref:flagellar motor protein MotB n=1 Tax=Tropicimonas sp. TaxID=2067044 RepID=UPI003A8724A6